MLSSNKRRSGGTRSCAQGFTLIELMAVVVVLGLLGAIAYPSYQDSVRKAKRAEGRAALMQLMQQEERYYSQHNGYLAFSSASTDADEKKFRWYSGDKPETSAYEISGAACPGESVANCIQLTARPGTPLVDGRFKDAACSELSLTSTGARSASGAATNCWQ